MSTDTIDRLRNGLVPPKDARHRLFHGRGGLTPGLEWLTVDRYPPVLFVTVFQAQEAAVLKALRDMLTAQAAALGCDAVLVQHRYLQGTPVETWAGQWPETCYAHEQGLRFLLDIERGQNIGFFPDMAPGRTWLQQRAEGKSVLNLFAFSCAFSVVARAAGAASVVNIDLSKPALALGQRNHQLNELDTRDIHFLPHNIFRSWKKLHQLGRYDIVIIDPPTDQKGSFVARKDYQKIIKQLHRLLKPEADILACLNAPMMGEAFLDEVVLQHLPGSRKVMRLPAAPGFEDHDEQARLKVVHYAYQRPAQLGQGGGH